MQKLHFASLDWGIYSRESNPVSILTLFISSNVVQVFHCMKGIVTRLTFVVSTFIIKC